VIGLLIGVGAIVNAIGSQGLLLGAAVIGGIALVYWGVKTFAARQPQIEEPETHQIVIQVGSGRIQPPQGRANLEPTSATPASLGRDAAFFGRGITVNIANRDIRDPLTYLATSPRNADASTIITSLQVGAARFADALPYWPSYADASSDQRALYLDWMAGGRTDSTVPLGYPFIFFYGLERRALVDGQDIDLCRAEVLRLLDLFGTQSGSFRGYARG
jgi:hypothetical protein